ncbi:FlgB family protein [Leisingera aquaemixtae]|uniref:Flagellar basal body rod protein FlgB n=1 Tax=Leisingera aquaemixtae TaxID=1396826 RepID=A0A0P1HNT9_9RHOB|nr:MULTISPECIES: FlgB family protein [Leisingera]QDI77472.1 FlgB family protein [Leisingera aquaemixtae]UWQ26796.1 FlgB family protein [Leisingera aquaemixtae]UWQ39353.1 FlgB family protein [Leisingera aquaemixtae]UWQ41461.1 FlgB family protein [Leisingera aquaemixtae]UWQ45722.1 FlgB family protein [Leisingera aquaemixtae]
MFTELNVFKISYSMATHAGKRQALVAQNIANADTPGYHAKDIKPFTEVFAAGARQSSMSATRDSHLNGTAGSQMDWAVMSDETGSDPNGNSVSVEAELLKGVDTERQHKRAMAIYKSSMNILRASLGKT